MDTLALLVALGALGVAGFLFSERDKPQASNDGELAMQVRALSEEVTALRAALAVRPTALTASKRGPGTAGHPGLTGTGAEAIAVDAHASIEERLAAIEAGQAELSEKVAENPGGSFRLAGRDGQPPLMLGGNHLLTSADQAEKTLKLDAAQRADLDRVIADAKAEMDRLKDTPNEDGETLRALEGGLDLRHEVGEDGKVDFDPSKIFDHMSNVSKFKRGKVPGTNETYAQAEKRIQANARQEVRRGLTPDQQKQWDRSQTGALLGGGGAVTTAFAVGSVVDVGGMDSSSEGR